MRSIQIRYDEQFYDDFEKLVHYLTKTEQYSPDLPIRIWQEIQQTVQIRAENISFITYKPYYIASDNNKYYLLPLKYDSIVYTVSDDTMVVLFLLGSIQDICHIIASRIHIHQ